MKVKPLSRVQLFVTPWTAAYQAPPSMGFSRQEYWSGVPSPSLREETRSYQEEGAGGGIEWEVEASRWKLLYTEWINKKAQCIAQRTIFNIL